MLYAAVLAGGRSSRMGRDKALLRLGGQTLLARALDLLERLGADRILLSGREGSGSVADLHPYAGPPGALLSLLAHLRREEGLDGSPLLLIPVDMPLLNVEVLARLPAALGSARAIHYEGEVFPCVFRATEALHDHLQGLFAGEREAGGKRSMKALLAALEATALPKGDIPDAVFMNVNQPGEWEAFLASH